MWLAGGVALAQGKLDSVRDAVRDGDHHDDDDDDNDDWLQVDDDDDWDPFSEALAWTVMVPFVLPRKVLEDTGQTTSFAAFPFRDGPGYWRFEEPGALESPRRLSLRPRVESAPRVEDINGVSNVKLTGKPANVKPSAPSFYHR